MKGKLEVIIGNMFSGKSSELIRRIKRENAIGKNILVINFEGDNRYTQDSIATHDHVVYKCVKTKELMSIDYTDIDSIFIDEGQFFNDLEEFVYNAVDLNDKHVVVSGLDGDCQRKPFGQMIDIIPMADTVDKLSAYCIKCKNNTYGPFTKKIVEVGDSIIDIGGSDKYIPVCRVHFNEPI
jgi:thymidine kinase